VVSFGSTRQKPRLARPRAGLVRLDLLVNADFGDPWLRIANAIPARDRSVK
jgi:hypothetical protein